jgi:nitrate reductase NapD
VGDEIHIAGIVVHVAPGRSESASAAIASLPGAEVRAAGSGKLVVTLEGDGSGQILERLESIRAVGGVLGAYLVYQHAESAESMNEQVSDEDIAP